MSGCSDRSQTAERQLPILPANASPIAAGAHLLDLNGHADVRVVLQVAFERGDIDRLADWSSHGVTRELLSSVSRIRVVGLCDVIWARLAEVDRMQQPAATIYPRLGAECYVGGL